MKINKINNANSVSRFIISAWIMVLLGVSTSLLANDRKLSNIKKEITELKDILFNPGKSQLAVLLSINAKTGFTLDSVNIYIDSKRTKTYLYTERESTALLNKATQKIYVGNLTEGEHTIKAQFSAMGKNNKNFNISSSLKFTKTNTAKYVELKISKSDQQDLPVLNINIWE